MQLREHAGSASRRRRSGTGRAGKPHSVRLRRFSDDGRFIAFESGAANLVPGVSDSSGDIYVRDLRTGDVKLASRAPGPTGAQGDLNSFYPSLSADREDVAFLSYDTNLSPADTTDDLDVYVRDLVANTTTLVSRATGAAGAKANAENGIRAARGFRRRPVGGFQLAQRPISVPTTLIRGPTYTCATCRRTRPPWSAARAARLAARGTVALSPDHLRRRALRRVRLQLHGYPSPGRRQTPPPVCSLRDLQANTTTWRAAPPAPQERTAPGSGPSISGDGQRVAFTGDSTLMPRAHGIFVRDLQAQTTVRASRATGPGRRGRVVGKSRPISADGRFVTFDTTKAISTPSMRLISTTASTCVISLRTRPF